MKDTTFKPVKKLYVRHEGIYKKIYSPGPLPSDLVLTTYGELTVQIARSLSGVGPISVENPIRLILQYEGEDPTETLITVNSNSAASVSISRPGKLSLRLEHPDGIERQFSRVYGKKTDDLIIWKLHDTIPLYITSFKDVIVKPGVKIPPGNMYVSRMFASMTTITFEDATDFLKGVGRLNGIFYGSGQINGLGVQDLSDCYDLANIFDSAETSLDLTGWVWPEKASYSYAFRGFRGSIVGLENLRTENLESADLSYFMYNTYLTPKINLSNWCVPLIISKPNYFGSEGGYNDGRTNYSMSSWPRWGECGSRSSNILNRSQEWSYDSWTNPYGLDKSKITRLIINIRYYGNNALYTWPYYGEASVTIQYSDNSTETMGIYSDGAHQGGRLAVGTFRGSQQNPTYFTDAQSYQFVVEIPTGKTLANITKYANGYVLDWYDEREYRGFEGGLENIAVLSDP